MAEYDFDIGILGGGAAGLTVAAGAARFGAKTLLIEKERVLGGDCLHYGCVPSKTLIRTAGVYHLVKNSGKFGLPRGEAGRVDFREVSGRIKTVVSAIAKHDSPERFCRLGARVEFGQAHFVDGHSVALEGKTYSAKSWVLATGSSPAVPPIDGLDTTPFLTNRHLFSLERLPESLLCLGGGPVSIEMAQAFNRLGTRVTVVERGSQILGKEDKDMADLVMNTLQAEGIAFHLNAAVIRARDLGSEREVAIQNGEGRTVPLRAEAILVAAGRTANLEGLGLEGIGVDFDSRGLKLDSRLRTNQKHLYGAGDVTGAYQFTHAAGYEGGIVLSNALLHLPRKVDYSLLPWCTFTDPELASIGVNEKRAKEEGMRYSVWTEEFRDNDRSLAEGYETGRIKMILDEKERPVGVQILGPHAGDLINEWVAVMNGKVRLSSLASAMHPYPTLGEINKRVTGDFLSQKIFSPAMRKGLRFLFGLKGRACG